MAGHLPDDQVKGIKQMFLMMDTDKNGNLNFQELKDGLRMIGQPIPDNDVQLLLEAVSIYYIHTHTHTHTIFHSNSSINITLLFLIEKADCDGNGTLDCDEFTTFAVHLKRISSEELLHQAFKHFDKNNNGYIEFHELQESLDDENDHLDVTDHQILHEIIRDADLDKVINFLHILTN